MMDPSPQQRQALRQTLRSRRQALSEQQQQQAAKQLAKLLIRQPLIQASQHIALYLANDGELNPSLTLEQLLAAGKTCYLPQLTDNNSLEFAQYDTDTCLRPNRFGIPEPTEAAHKRRAEDLDLVLLPLVGFDVKGNRMGMGGGFYDRTFAFKQHKTHHRPVLIGLAHQCQHVASIDSAHWDVSLDAIATDQGLVIINDLIRTPGDFVQTDFLK